MAAEIDKAVLLGHGTLFAELAPAEREGLARYAKRRTVQAHQVICHKGTRGGQLFVLVHGRAKVSTLSADGREATLGLIEDGDVFGEISMLDGGERTATVAALEPCELLVLERRDVLTFLERHPQTAVKLLHTLCRRLRLATLMTEDALFLPLSARLAKRLLLLAQHCGRPTPQGIRLGLKLSQQELGHLIGGTRESVNQQLRRWKDEGLIAVDEGYLVIRDRAQLEQLGA